jgi:hypothetical protein
MVATHASDDLDLPPLVEGEAIRGRVTDVQGEPLVGVRIEAAETGGGDLDLLPVLSDGDGVFAVEGLAPGVRYDLRFTLGGVRARVLDVPAGSEGLHARLARPQGILLVVKTGSGAPPPALLHVLLERDAPIRPVREYFGRSLKPRLLLWSIRPGRYTVRVWGGPYLPVEAHGVVVREGEPAPEVEVVLGPEGGRVRGRCRDGGGQGAEGWVSWRRLDASGHAPQHMTTVATLPDGSFLLQGLPAGRYRLSGYATEAGVGEAEVEVQEEHTTEATLRLR